jgi:hypothetical protein
MDRLRYKEDKSSLKAKISISIRVKGVNESNEMIKRNADWAIECDAIKRDTDVVCLL